MIQTVTLNAALDVTYRVAELRAHASHRVVAVTRRAGGKGVNVTRVLHQLDHATTATGFLGGSVALAFGEDLDRAGITHDFVPIAGDTRTCVAVVDDLDATVFNEPGPMLGAADWQAFVARFDAGAADVVVLSGSLPPGIPEDAYAQLCRRSSAVRLVDAAGPGLSAAAAAAADVLLPNRDELAETTGEPDPLQGARALVAAGAGAVVVSLGAEGLLAVTPETTWRARPPERLLGNPTGAGDALTAAIAATVGRPWRERIAEAIAWSAAAVAMPLAGEVDPETLAHVRAHVSVQEDPCP